MVVITGIKTAIKIAPIIYKVSKIVYKGVQKTNRGRQWIARHPKALRYGAIGATAGSLLLDLTNIDYSAIQIPKFPGKKRQTRGNVYKSRYGQQYQRGDYSREYRRCRRQKPFY